MNPILICCLLPSLTMTTAHAAKPLWTVTPAAGSNPTQTVPENGTANVQYIVENQSHKSKRLVMLAMPGVTQATSCQMAPKGQSGSSCTLMLAIAGSSLPKKGVHGGPNLCQTNLDGSPNPNQCYQPAANHVLNLSLAEISSNTTLSISLNTLVLATQGILTEASGAGNLDSKARKFIITNTGAATAMDVNYTIAPALPVGTTVSPAICGNIAVGGTCELTVTPGNNPSAAADDEPTPSVLTAQGSNTPTAVTSDIILLTYGNRYQGGFVFAIDDSTDDTMSVSGKVAALNDQSDSFRWGPTDEVGGISEDSTAGPNSCDGNSDGACNTDRIIDAGLEGDVAANLCSATIAGFNDWYLPAICEMGFDALNIGTVCGSQVSPTLQNMQSNLVGNGDVGNLAGDYWSSTERSFEPAFSAWIQRFAMDSNQSNDFKIAGYGVRCVRALTI